MLFNSFGANFQATFVVCFFLTNYYFESSLYEKLKNWMSNSVDPDETARLTWIYSASKSLLFSPVAAKELIN